jgi:hypothetical protein
MPENNEDNICFVLNLVISSGLILKFSLGLSKVCTVRNSRHKKPGVLHLTLKVPILKSRTSLKMNGRLLPVIMRVFRHQESVT